MLYAHHDSLFRNRGVVFLENNLEYEKKLTTFINQHKISGEHLSFKASCHSILDAAKAVDGTPQDFVKNVCMIDSDDQLIVAIVKGEDNASTKRVGKAFGIERPRLASPDEILRKTGYPCGGTPSFGFSAYFIIDPKVLEQEIIYTGGGSENALVRIGSKELVRVNQGRVERIRR